ncbi:MAG: UDP-N-acetylmuramoyl-tripeptide--D-alanyl-D-alanine ligase [Porticoccaceae bacterium]|nr:MAG: UDP-N-acetylmuramoyl-tripeptide--D-alanyl-D-alanine ligase [Porticoccaceae bacterium]
MIGTMTLAEAAMEFGGTLLYPDCRFAAVSTDTRTLAAGELFVALVGARHDAHHFLAEAARRAAGLVVSRPDKSLSLPQWVVEDTTRALGWLAQLNRWRFDGPLVGITGSTGKTTVKEMVAAIFTGRAPTLVTRGNLNNRVGLPLTLLELAEQHRYAVVEMGAGGPGDIAYLAGVARPDIALVTNVRPAHIAYFGSEAAIADTKGAIYEALPAAGVAVINLDERWWQAFRRRAGRRTAITFSLADREADVRAVEVEERPGGSRFLLEIGARSAEVSLPLPGRHNVANALAAAACAAAAGFGVREIAAGLARVQAAPGRLCIRTGRGGAVVIDDSYNANPGSVRAAIDVLAARPGRRILALGDMAELGALSAKSHEEMGRYARAKDIDALYATGEFARFAARGFGEGARLFADRASLAEALAAELAPGVTVLVKGSRSAAMEEVVAALVEEVLDAARPG